MSLIEIWFKPIYDFEVIIKALNTAVAKGFITNEQALTIVEEMEPKYKTGRSEIDLHAPKTNDS